MGIAPYTLNENAKDLWMRHKARLLAIWKDTKGRQKGVSGFSGGGLRGAGRLGLPCWAEVKFEGATLPKLDRSWPKDVQEAWREIKEA